MIIDGYWKIYREFELYLVCGICVLMNNKLNYYIMIILFIFVVIVVYGYLIVGFFYVY